jgi:hypothetical protein
MIYETERRAGAKIGGTMRSLLWLLVVTLPTASFSSSLAAECIAKERKPVVVSGPMCGEVFDTTGGLAPDTSLYLYDVSNVAIAEARVDSHGRFVFPDLPGGRYRLGGDGWYIEWGQVEIRKSKGARTCTHPVVVYVGISYPACSGGWVSEKWDRHAFPDGRPREK